MSEAPADYGPFSLTSARLLTLPQWTPRGVVSVDADVNGSNQSRELAERALADPHGQPWITGVKRGYASIANKAMQPISAKRRRLAPVLPAAPPVLAPLPPAPPPPPPPPPVISSVGVMDVGAAGCNVLFDQNNQPVAYYDLGSPLGFNLNSIPNTLRFTNPAYIGPILQNTAGNLEVVLSHWDWDHWRLADIANITTLPWTYRVAPVGWAVNNFFNLLTNPIQYGGAPITAFANYTIYQCVPPPGANPGVLINNSGLAMSVTTLLPFADPTHHDILMTADANVSTLPFAAGAVPNLTGLSAVHHGSNANGATAVLPTQVAAYAGQGRIAYSYGVRPNGTHCYGFPVPAAIANYVAAGWGAPGNHMSTAKGIGLNAPYPPGSIRGNISMGAVPVLGAPYNATAFANYPNNL